jgi:hypothetical protein
LSPSFGCTCAARARAAATLSLLGLLLAVVALQPGAAAAASTSSPSLSLGFGPSSLVPVSGGTPVYTVGETIWAESGYNSSLGATLVSPSSAPVAQLDLEPQAVTPVHTFTSADPDGVWNLTLATQQGPIVVPVRFVNLADHRPVLLSPFQYSLDGGKLTISAPANLGDSYDQEVCAEGVPAQPPVSLSLPADMGDSGSISLTPGGSLSLVTLGVLNTPFSFWVELYHTYSLDEGGTSNLAAYTVEAAQSQPIDITAPGPTAAALTWNAPLREGRYDLRAFYQNSTGLQVSQTELLVLNDSSWVSLSSSCVPQELQSSDISYSASLTAGPSSWPRTLYYMYRTLGVEAVVAYPVKANLSSVDFQASPWGEPVQDAKVTATGSSGILQTSQQAGSLFVLASEYPDQLSYSLAIGALGGLAQGSVTIGGAFSTQKVEVSLAQLTVHVVGGQSSPIMVEAAGSSGVDVTRGPIGGNHSASLYLPTGSYTVTASEAGGSESAQVSVTDGVASAVTLNFNAIPSLEIILAATAAVAAVANVLVWTLRARARRLKLPSPAKG